MAERAGHAMHTALVQLDCGAVVDPKVLLQVQIWPEDSFRPAKAARSSPEREAVGLAFRDHYAYRNRGDMIRSFANQRTANVFNGVRDRSFPPSLLKRAASKLDRINYAASVNDLLVPPGNRLERLRGDREGQYSIRVSRSWRICFVWKDGDAFEVELTPHYD